MKYPKYRDLIKARQEFGIPETMIGRIGGVSKHVISEIIRNKVYRPKANTLAKIMEGIDYFLSLEKPSEKKRKGF